MSTELEKILTESSQITNTDKKLSTFFGNCAMARLLEVFLNNPGKKLNVQDVMDKSDLSTKSIWINMPYLVDNDMILEEHYKYYKFYKLNTKNTLVKQISKFRNILLVTNYARK